MNQHLAPVLPCNDLGQAQKFFERLGFRREESPDDYRMLSDSSGGHIHLAPAVEGWLMPGRNPFGVYLYREDVDGVAAAFKARSLRRVGPVTSRGECTSSR
jgi:hypothetical protein